MRLIRYFILSTLLILLLPDHSPGQHEALKTMLEGKTTYREIVQTFNTYLDNIPAGYDKDRLQKHFARWAQYQSMHLGPDGEFVNISRRTLDALQAQTDAPATTTDGSWSFVGPSSTTTNNPGADLNGLGRVDRLAFHPSDPDIIYAGTPAGGLWRTTNGGTNWSNISNFIPSLGISGIVVDHSDPNTIYVLTGDGDSYINNYFVYLSGYIRLSVGVLVTHDGGITWEETGTLSNNEFTGFRLVQHPSNASILIAATSDGLYRTTNGGQTWVQERAGKHYDVEFKPGTPSTVYASGPGAFYYSTNTGDTWNNNSTFNVALCGGGRIEIGVTPDAANTVYLFAGPKTGGNTFCGFYRSQNSGVDFTRLCNSPNILGTETGGGDDQSQYDMGVAVNPSNDQTIIACGLVTHRSTNGGSVFNSLSTYRESGGNYIHPDVHFVAYNPLNNYLYAAGDGGVHRSTNNGTSWTDIYNGINATQFYHLDDFDGNQFAVLAGCQDNGVKYKSANTAAFSHITCCDGADAIIDYTDQTKGFVAVNTSIMQYSNFTANSPSQILNGGFFMQIELNTSNTNTLYVSSNWVYSYTVSTGVTTQLGTAHGHWALKTCPSNSNRLYAAGGTSAFAVDGDMYMTIDGGATWDTISDHPGFPANYPRISDIGVEPDISSHVFATFSGYTAGLKVLYSSDAGMNWINISYDLPNIPVWSIEVDAAGNAYVGCDYGVYYRASGSTHWEPFHNFLPNSPVSDLAINEGSDQLLASTFGRGIWKSPLHVNCPTDIQLISNVSGHYFRSASNSITMSGQLIGGLGTNVALRSDGYVDLTAGFRANSDPGEKFLAYLGPCQSGLPPVTAPQRIGLMETLSGNDYTLDRHSGTLEVRGENGTRELIIRQSKEGPVRILLGDEKGFYVRDIANYDGLPGTRSELLALNDLQPGLYFLYLVVGNTVTHLQEVLIK